MFLYELALQLGLRSTDLVDRARALGLNVGPSSFLDPQQVQLLATAPPVAPPAPMGSPAEPHAGPATYAPPEPGDPTSAPPPPPAPSDAAATWASWTTPGGSTLGAPVGAPTPPPMAPPAMPAAPMTRPPMGQPPMGQPPVAFGAPNPTTLGQPGAIPGGFGGPPVGAPVPTGGKDDNLPPKTVALYIGVPVVLLLAVFAFFVVGTKDSDSESGGGDKEAAKSSGVPDGDLNGDGFTPIIMDGEVTDVDEFCRVWDEVEASIGAEAETWAEVRQAGIDEFPIAIDGMEELVAFTSGPLRQDITAATEMLQETLEVWTSLPSDESEFTAEQRKQLRESSDVGGVGERFDAAGTKYCDAAG